MSSKYDIDTYLNPLTPPNPIHHLPQPLSHFLGHRPPTTTSPPRKTHPLLIWLFCFLGSFLGVALLEAVYLHLPPLSNHQVPIIIASFGAAAILEYNTIESPLAQPRNLVLGHFLAALIGVSITKLFLLLPSSEFEELRWLAGALSVGVASVVMAMTKTVHPPAGATALLTATSPEITDLGWWTLALVVLGCMLMLSSALVLNNIVRRFPVYWWAPVDLREMKKKRKMEKEERGKEKSGDKEGMEKVVKMGSADTEGSDTVRGGSSSTESTHVTKGGNYDGENTAHTDADDVVVVSKTKVSLPQWVLLSDVEKTVLAEIQARLLQGEAGERQPSYYWASVRGQDAV